MWLVEHWNHVSRVVRLTFKSVAYPSTRNYDEAQFIVIDGAPGIGKYVLLREIAFCGTKIFIISFVMF